MKSNSKDYDYIKKSLKKNAKYIDIIVLEDFVPNKRHMTPFTGSLFSVVNIQKSIKYFFTLVRYFDQFIFAFDDIRMNGKENSDYDTFYNAIYGFKQNTIRLMPNINQIFDIVTEVIIQNPIL